MAATDRLIVTLAAEVVGYSRLIRADEKGALEQLEAHRNQFVYPKIAEHSGRIVRATGDNLLVEFESATEAVRCAAELQSGMIGRNIRTLPDRRITFRIGVSFGQVTGNGDDLVTRAVAALPRDTLATLIKPGAEVYLGRGNIAVRLAALAEPAGICVSGVVRDAIRDRLPYLFKRHRKTEPRDRRTAGTLLCHEIGRRGIRYAPHDAANCRRCSGRVCCGWRLRRGIVGVARREFVDGPNPRASHCGLARAACRHNGGRGTCAAVAAILGCEQHCGRH